MPTLTTELPTPHPLATMGLAGRDIDTPNAASVAAVAALAGVGIAPPKTISTAWADYRLMLNRMHAAAASLEPAAPTADDLLADDWQARITAWAVSSQTAETIGAKLVVQLGNVPGRLLANVCAEALPAMIEQFTRWTEDRYDDLAASGHRGADDTVAAAEYREHLQQLFSRTLRAVRDAGGGQLPTDYNAEWWTLHTWTVESWCALIDATGPMLTNQSGMSNLALARSLGATLRMPTTNSQSWDEYATFARANSEAIDLRPRWGERMSS